MITEKFIENAQGILIENDRWHEWIKSSLAFKSINEYFLVIIQGLGRLDCELIFEDSQFAILPQQNQNTIEESFKLSGRFTRSYLWVLGLYELVRALDQKCTENPKYFNKSLNKAITDLKKNIGRLRVPLAKLEASKRNNADDPIAWPAIHQTKGISWRVKQGVFISRRDLSDQTLFLFKTISESLKRT